MKKLHMEFNFFCTTTELSFSSTFRELSEAPSCTSVDPDSTVKGRMFIYIESDEITQYSTATWVTARRKAAGTGLRRCSAEGRKNSNAHGPACEAALSPGSTSAGNCTERGQSYRGAALWAGAGGAAAWASAP